MRLHKLAVIGAGLAAFALVAGALAQSSSSFDLWWNTIAGGGGGSSSADYAMSGSIAQPAVGELSSADFRLSAGFWPAAGVETPAPTVTGSPPPTSTAEPSSTATSTLTATRTGSPPAATPTPTVTPTGQPALAVNTTADTNDGTCNSAHCSLREAINAANANAGPDTITFNIPSGDPGCDASGVCTIQPSSLLPAFTDDGTTVDGYAQPGAGAGSNPVLKIVLDGQNSGSFSGLVVNSADNVIEGLVIQRFTPFSGVHIEGSSASGNLLRGNFIGTDVTGTQARGNCTPPTSCAAVWIRDGAHNNIIGPDNLIAFNGQGVWIIDSGSVSNVVTRNRIHSNTLKGIRLFGGGNNGLPPPVINAVIPPGQVGGTACANCTVEIFSDAADEGRVYEGAATADGSGNWTFTKAGGLTGPNVTATATDGAGNTSEFSAPVELDREKVFLPLVRR